MFERFAQDAREVLQRAQDEASQLRHNFIGTEHILLGLEGTSAAYLLAGMGAPIPMLKETIVARVGPGPTGVSGNAPFTARAKKALELSLREALARHEGEIRPPHLLLGLLREGEGLAWQVLREAGVTHDGVLAVMGPAPARPRGPRRWRPPFSGGVSFGGVSALPGPGKATAGAVGIAALAEGWAGSERVGTHHYLLALLAEEQGLAAKVLAALGVTKDQVVAKIDELGTADTSDADQVTVEVGGRSYALPPAEAERLQQLLELGPQERGRKLGGL
jgi:ATP-dependent Clp protease ATP-binding subunit ClpC